MRAKPIQGPEPKGLASQLAEVKLAGSGLDMADAKKLRIETLSAAETLGLGFQPLPSLKINYLLPTGKPQADWPGHKPFFRVRYLAEPAGFDKLTDKKPMRYTQPPSTVCCPYFPQNQDWSVLLDPNTPLILTEGELKAAAACKAEFPTVGLGGVYNWRALSKGVEFLPDLEGIVWLLRNTYICFDSDYLTNPMVCAALRDLGEMLVDRGAYVHVVTLPSISSAKTGLDDFLVAEGADAFGRLLHIAQPLGLTRALFAFNEKYVYIQDPGLVMATQTQAKIAPAAFTGHLEASKTYQELALKSDGTISYKPVSAAGAWISWPLRRQATRLTYAPGKDKEVAGELNTWPGWGVAPVKGDVGPWLKLVDHIFTDAEPEFKRWFFQWCAYPLKYPGTKLFSSVVLHGVRQGTGKSLVGYTLGRIHGRNFVEISQADLRGSFNEWAEGKTLVMGDDVTGSDKRADADTLKKLITQSEMRVNVKYVPSYVIPDCINYLFTSNHPDAFFLEDTDRRYGIHEVTVGPLPDEFYASYAGVPGITKGWLDSGGAAAVFDWLLKFDMSGFNPKAAAFRGKAKERMITDIQSDLGAWVRELLSAPERVLRLDEMAIERDLFTSAELLKLYDPMGSTRTTAGGLGRELKRAGAFQVCGGSPIRLADGAQVRPFAVRGFEKWRRAGQAAVAAHMDAGGMGQSGPRKKKF